jgi:hypothetical protein
MKITIEPTSQMETFCAKDGNRIEARIWKGVTDQGTEVVCLVALIGVATTASAKECRVFEKALKEVETERELVHFSTRVL